MTLDQFYLVVIEAVFVHLINRLFGMIFIAHEAVGRGFTVNSSL